jgi:Na+(H+)/acetate symporter ActP
MTDTPDLFTLLRNRYGPFRYFVILFAALFLAVYIGFRIGLNQEKAFSEALARTQQSAENLKQENEALIRQLNIAKVRIEMEEDAQKAAAKQVRENQQAKYNLRRQLSFYQRAIAPEQTMDGFFVDRLELFKGDLDRQYEFNIVMMQQYEVRRLISGDIEVEITGRMKNNFARYSLREIMSTESDLQFSFKFFQILSGTITLPEGFEPVELKIKAKVFRNKRKQDDYNQTFEWTVSERLGLSS